jgi:very-long-chain (3R)-3-hydroxyacyl-CoA dehydratase
MPSKSQQPQPSKSRPGPKGIHKIYLVAYNLLSGVLWFSVLSRVLTIGKLEGGFESGRVYAETERIARLVQTGAVLEVINSVLGTLHSRIPMPAILAYGYIHIC